MDIFIDNNVWDYFHKHDLDLLEFFPSDEYKLCITKHGKYEIQQMPSSCDKLKKYVFKNLERYVEVDSIFGFYNPDLPEDEQRYSGFGKGRFISDEESQVYGDLNQKYGTSVKRKETQILFKQEADIELATRAIGSVVLTFDRKKGPLKDIADNGGTVVFLNVQEAKEKPLACFLDTLLNDIGGIKT